MRARPRVVAGGKLVQIGTGRTSGRPDSCGRTVRQPSRDSMRRALVLTIVIKSGFFCFNFTSGTTIEIVARQAPWLPRMGAAMQATEKSDSPACIDRPCSNAAAAARASTFSSVSARPVGEAIAHRVKMARRSASGKWPTSSRPDAVQFSGVRVPTPSKLAGSQRRSQQCRDRRR